MTDDDFARLWAITIAIMILAYVLIQWYFSAKKQRRLDIERNERLKKALEQKVGHKSMYGDDNEPKLANMQNDIGNKDSKSD